MSEVEVFWGSGSQPSWRVLLALVVKRVPYVSRLVSFQERQHRTPEFLAMNPRHKVPTLRHGEYTLYESIAILSYLDAEFPEPRLFGSNPRETGLVWRYIWEFTSYFEPVLLDEVVRPIFNGFDAARAEKIRAALLRVHDELGRLETTLMERSWLVGETISAADIAIFPFLKGLERAAGKPAAAELALRVTPLDQHYPALGRWVERIEALPGYDQTYPPHWRNS